MPYRSVLGAALGAPAAGLLPALVAAKPVVAELAVGAEVGGATGEALGGAAGVLFARFPYRSAAGCAATAGAGTAAVVVGIVADGAP